jgi:hypothetical protein
LFCETTKLRLNFVHCFIQKISLSVLIRIGDLPSANVITELRWILKMHQVSCLFCPWISLLNELGHQMNMFWKAFKV